MPTKVVAAVSAASMAAVPPLAGFIAKEEAYGSLVAGTSGDRFVLAGIVVGSVLTAAYSLRIVAALFRPALVRSEEPAPLVAPAPAARFVAPALILSASTVVLGLAPMVWSDLIDHAAGALNQWSTGDGVHVHLALWHGVNTALLLSVATLAVGVTVFALRGPVARVQGALSPRTTGTDVYEAIVRKVLSGAGRVTGIVQSGSLPVYVAVILTTAAVAPIVALLGGEWWSGWPAAYGRVEQLPVATLIVVAAVAATLATRRFVAAVLLGAVGYGMAIFFVIQGAPDVALTQFGVETLSVVVFLLVLRRLPDRFERPAPAMGQPLRIVVSVMVGVFVVVMALASSGARTEAPVSREMVERAYPEGHGHNIVNVILVDIRGIDTLGEITVLATAAIGIAAVARSAAKPRRVTANRAGADR